MKILFDQGTPRPLREHLNGHSVDTAAEQGWSGLGNGDLIEKAEQEGYEVLITTDQNMRHQQNLADKKLAVVVLLSTAWPNIQLRTEEIRNVLSEIRPGEVREVQILG